MKKIALTLLLSMLFFAGFAKTTVPPKPIFSSDFVYRLPAPENSVYVYPDWYYEYPIPENTSYVFAREQGEGATMQEALNRAIAQVIESTANRLGNWVNTADVHNAILNGTDYKVGSRAMRVPIKKVCEFYIIDSVTQRWTVWILCQVAAAGNVDHDFKPFLVCAGHTKFDKQLAWWKKCSDEYNQELKDARKKSDARALGASTFIPGMGQMLKKQGGTGAAFLISELIVFGGGTACYFLGKEQSKKMKDITTSYDDYRNAKNMKNIYDIAMYTAFGVGAAIHIANMVHAWYVKDKNLPVEMSFAPAILPTNELLLPSYAYGASVQIKF